MNRIPRRRTRARRTLAVVAGLTLTAACGASSSTGAPPSPTRVITSTAATTTVSPTTVATRPSATGFERLQPGPVAVPECEGGNASARIALDDGRLRQIDLSDTYVCLEDDGQARMMMPMPPLPPADAPTYVIDVRNDDGGLFLFTLPEGYPRPGAVGTADHRAVAHVTSPNGRVLAVFDPQALQGPVVAHFVVRGADGAVVAELDAEPDHHATTVGGPQPTLPDEDAAVPAAIAASLQRDPGPPYLGVIVTDTEATCIGEGLVAALGLSRVRALAIGAAAWPSLATGTGLTPEEAARIVDVLQTCAEHWKRFAFLYATQGTGEMSEASAQCVEGTLTDADARTFFVKERSGYRSIDHILPVEAAVDACVTPTERDRIDWN